MSSGLDITKMLLQRQAIITIIKLCIKSLHLATWITERAVFSTQKALSAHSISATTTYVTLSKLWRQNSGNCEVWRQKVLHMALYD